MRKVLFFFLLSGLAFAQHSVTLNWSENSPNDPATKFNVCRSTTKGGEIPCTSPLATTTGLTYSDTAVLSGTTYWYSVIAVDAGGNQSSPSNEVSALIPGPTAPVLNNPVVASSVSPKSATGETVAKIETQGDSGLVAKVK